MLDLSKIQGIINGMGKLSYYYQQEVGCGSYWFTCNSQYKIYRWGLKYQDHSKETEQRSFVNECYVNIYNIIKSDLWNTIRTIERSDG